LPLLLFLILLLPSMSSTGRITKPVQASA
jgi:hypothetical protein